jgi:four helix bundle protein
LIGLRTELGISTFVGLRFQAKSSCAELRSQLYVAFDIGYIDQQYVERLLADAEEVARIVGGLDTAVERQRNEQRGKP